MTPEEWARLMRQARTHAGLHNHRVKIIAFEHSDRATAYFGSRWAYVIDCPARARDLLPGH